MFLCYSSCCILVDKRNFNCSSKFKRCIFSEELLFLGNKIVSLFPLKVRCLLYISRVQDVVVKSFPLVVLICALVVHWTNFHNILTLRNILDLLGSICKTKTGAKKSVHLGVLPLMLSMYQESLRYDHRNRNAAMRRSLLLVIKACVVFSK